MPLEYRTYKNIKFYGNPEKADVLKYSRLVGLELEQSIRNSAPMKVPLSYGVTSDGGGYEIQTPPASADKLERIIKKVTDEISKGGGYATTGAGYHIHLDGSGFVDNHVNAIRLTNTYFVIEPIIYSMLSQYRRSSSWCRNLTTTINEHEFRRLLRSQHKNDIYYLHKTYYKQQVDQKYIDRNIKNNKNAGQRLGFNLNALFAYGHIEMRYHAGTVNRDKIQNWAWLHLHLMDWVMNNYSKNKIMKIREETDISKKTEMFFKHMNVPETLRRYIKYRQGRFSQPLINEFDDDGDYTNNLLT